MNIVTSAPELDQELQRLLDYHGCALVSNRHLAMEARACRDESQIYDHNGATSTGEPFFHYLVEAGTAIFLFDGEPFLVYVFNCNPHELITYVEAEFSVTDVDKAKYYVSTVLGKHADIAASSAAAYLWMDDRSGA